MSVPSVRTLPLAVYETDSPGIVVRLSAPAPPEDTTLITQGRDTWDAMMRLVASPPMAAEHHSVSLFESSLSSWTPVTWGTGVEVAAIPDMRELHAALADLDRLDDEAREEGIPAPAAESVANARTLLPALYAIYPARYRVAPTERRGVSIDPPMREGGAVSFECGPDGAVYCMAVVDGNGRRAKFYQMEGLPDAFMAKALRDLARR